MATLRASLKSVYIFGAGGHGREIAWVVQRAHGASVKVKFVVDHPQYWRESVDGIAVALYADVAPDPEAHFVAAIGDPAQRRRAAEEMEKRLCALTLIDPSAIHSEDVQIGTGSVIMPGCILTRNVILGRHVHLNIGCRLSHDVMVGDFATLSPGAHIAGNVHVGAGAFLGINATVINGLASSPLTIGAGAVVAAGACVTKSVPPMTLVAGVPATIRREILVPPST